MAPLSLLACLINGQRADTLAATDRGLAYGDGVFETIAIVAGQPALWDLHLKRLVIGCDQLGFTPPSVELLNQDLAALKMPQTGILKLIVTRGSGGQGYAPPECPQPARIIQVLSPRTRPKEWRYKGVEVRWCQTRLAAQPALAGIKHLNRLEQVLARQEWQEPEIAEGLMCDSEGALVEATAANLIIEHNKEWIIPLGNACGVEGVMQSYLIDLARQWSIPITRRIFWPDEITAQTAMYLCNSLIGIWPVHCIEGQSLTLSPYIGSILDHLITQQQIA